MNAADRFIGLRADIMEQIEMLQDRAEDHFGVEPDSVTWADVGDLQRIRAALAELGLVPESMIETEAAKAAT